MHLGRTLLTALVGLLFMTFVALDLVIFGVVALDSALVTVLMAIGLLGGGALGWMAGARRAQATTAPAVPPPPPAPLPPPAS